VPVLTAVHCRQRSRRHMLRVNTLFKYVSYHPLEHQVVTTGTDRKIGFWETFDGSLIRELDGSLTDSVNAIDVSDDGVYVVSGGADHIVKVRAHSINNSLFSFTSVKPVSDSLGKSNLLSDSQIDCMDFFMESETIFNMNPNLDSANRISPHSAAWREF